MAEPPKTEKPEKKSGQDNESDDDEPIVGKGAFGERILLRHDAAVKHKSPYFPDGHLSIEIIGSSGCGKSHMLLSIIPQISNLSQVIVLSLVTNNPVYDQLQRWCKRVGIDYEFESEPNAAKALIEEMIRQKDTMDAEASEEAGEERRTQGMIIMDDFSQQKSGRSDPYNQLTAMVSAMLRNYGYHSIFITQSPTNVPTLFRNNTNIRFIFNLGDTHALRSIRNDVIASNVIDDPKQFDELYRLVAAQHHAYMMVVTKGEKKQLFIWLPSFLDVENGGPGRDYQPGRDSTKDALYIEAQRPQLVVMDGPEAIEHDLKLRQEIEKYKSISGKGEISRMAQNRARDKLRWYVRCLSGEHRMGQTEIYDLIYRKFGVDLG